MGRDNWQRRELAQLTQDYAGRSMPTTFGSIEKAVAEARVAQPDLRPAFVSYPGTGYSGEHHYGVFMNGGSALGERNYRPVLVDAETSDLTGVPQWPLTLTAMYVTQPLHFGDYAGLPLKIVWAVLDILAIVVLASGIYLWLGRRGQALHRRVLEVVEGGDRS